MNGKKDDRPVVTRLVDQVNEELADLGIRKSDTEKIIRAAMRSLAGEIEDSEEGEKVTISGLGSFEIKLVQERKAASGLNGGRKDTVIPEHKKVTFRASKRIRQHLNPHMKVK